MMYMEWESDLYDFSDPEVRLKYVPQLGCSVGAQSLCCANRGSRTRPQGAKVMKIDVLSQNIVSTRFKVLLGSKNVVLAR